MKPTQKHPGYYWTSDDDAKIVLKDAGPTQPLTVRCYNMQDHLNRGSFRDVPLATLEYLAAGIFGEPRGKTTRWTGDSHRYGIYRNPNGLYKNGIVILACHGGGCEGYVFDNVVAGETWEHIAATFKPEMVWNICNQIAHAYKASRDAERARNFEGFATGTLIRRKRNGRYVIEQARINVAS